MNAIRHIDGDPKNHAIENLRVVTMPASPPQPRLSPSVGAGSTEGRRRLMLARWNAAVKTFAATSVGRSLDELVADDIAAERAWLSAADFPAATPYAVALPDKWTVWPDSASGFGGCGR